MGTSDIILGACFVFDFGFDGTKCVQELGLLISDKVYQEAIKIVTGSSISSINPGFLGIFFEHTIFLTESYIEYLLSKYHFRVIKKEYFDKSIL